MDPNQPASTPSNLPANQLPSRHSKYEPFAWIFWVRIAQLVLTILVIALAAYAASQSLLGLGLSFSFWTIAWSVIWIPVVTWAIPRMKANYRPNIIVLVFECLSCFWWLVSFAAMAALVAATSVAAAAVTSFTSSFGYKNLRRSPYNTYDDSTSSSSSYYSTDDLTDSLSDSIDDAIGGNTEGAWTASKVATAFAAVNWVLFTVTFIAICIRIHRQRRERIAEIYQGAGNTTINQTVVVVTDKTSQPVATDKTPQPIATAV